MKIVGDIILIAAAGLFVTRLFIMPLSSSFRQLGDVVKDLIVIAFIALLGFFLTL